MIASMNSVITEWTRSGGSTNSIPDRYDDHLLIDVADAAVRDASLDDDRAIAEREAEIVQRIELQREVRFDLGAADADLLDR